MIDSMFNAEDFAKLHLASKGVRDAVPASVVDLKVRRSVTPAKAWRIYLGLTPWDVAKRLGIGLVSFARLERDRQLTAADRARLAGALHIQASQLDF